ncbi:hypothetical protein TRFO_28577 [Tritrichomonas foetus]|uniref:Uncharacterized protein n=1 Tax=Tritrichomonas foetus TaxID=1144522 RepID=A0A1J4JYB7_9EUKA|nr:hypothetical protein TRFO_28577 [Tritrichomonas foetus]|eukprot:OHT03987.1 hypothetical protein TRFO_28577 [Tritrichomonas foetus]
MITYKQCDMIMEKVFNNDLSMLIMDREKFPPSIKEALALSCPNYPSLLQIKQSLDNREQDPDTFIDNFLKYLQIVPKLVPPDIPIQSIENCLKCVFEEIYKSVSNTVEIVRSGKENARLRQMKRITNQVQQLINLRPQFQDITENVKFCSHGIGGKVNPP